MSTTRPRRALVIGGSLGGLLAANLLARNGWDVEVFEQASEELIKRITEIKESLFRLNFKKALGDTDTVKRIRTERRELARLKTILRARALGIEK